MGIIALDNMHFFKQKVLIFFRILFKKICCGYSLELPHQLGYSMEPPQHMFSFGYSSNLMLCEFIGVF